MVPPGLDPGRAAVAYFVFRGDRRRRPYRFLLVAVLLVVRSDQLAIRVGSFSGRMARKVRTSVDPDAWVRACVDFRVQISARFRYGFVRSLLALCGMLAADLTVLVLSLRFVGVSSSEVPLVYVAIAYLFAYPFTLFPFSGLGVVDALVLAAVVEAGGLEVEAAAVAASSCGGSSRWRCRS